MSKTIKARRDYMTDGICGVPPEKVRVTGFADVNGERWCRVRYIGERTAGILTHPSRLAEIKRA